MGSWQPHGLIQDRMYESSYRDAKLAFDAYGNSQDLEEYFTMTLFSLLFSKQIFTEGNFFVNSQVPLSTKRGADEECHFVIQYVDGDDYEHHILCIVEGKSAENVTTSKISALETQAQDHCQYFLEAHPEVDLAYACTVVGVFIRCWSLRRGDRDLQGLWGGSSDKDHFEHYRDVGLDAHRGDIELAFRRMKSIPLESLQLGPDHSAFGSSSYGTAVANNAADQSRFEAPPVPSQPMEVEPTDPLVDIPQLLDQNHVSVSIREYGESIAENLYRFIHEGAAQETRGREWYEETVLREGQPTRCMVYTGRNSGIRYWTWTLDPERML